jgi:hypothetical protein
MLLCVSLLLFTARLVLLIFSVCLFSLLNKEMMKCEDPTIVKLEQVSYILTNSLFTYLLTVLIISKVIKWLNFINTN